MNVTEFSPVPTSALTIPPRNQPAIRMMRSWPPNHGNLDFGLRRVLDLQAATRSKTGDEHRKGGTDDDGRNNGATNYAPKITPAMPGTPA